jgi:hypothetical protein
MSGNLWENAQTENKAIRTMGAATTRWVTYSPGPKSQPDFTTGLRRVFINRCKKPMWGAASSDRPNSKTLKAREKQPNRVPGDAGLFVPRSRGLPALAWQAGRIC